MRYLIAYDIRDDGDRARLAAALSAWGDRIQLSVFECTLAADELEELLGRVNQMIDHDHDSVHVVPIRADCDEGRHVVGQASRPEEEWCWVV